jgi:hypothetical protein
MDLEPRLTCFMYTRRRKRSLLQWTQTRPRCLSSAMSEQLFLVHRNLTRCGTLWAISIVYRFNSHLLQIPLSQWEVLCPGQDTDTE